MQTLHPEEFDRGQILAQSEYPGFKHSCDNVPDLEATVSPKAAEMLVQGLKDLVFVPPPRQDVGWYNTRGNNRPVRHAPKITPEDRHIDWATWPANRILRTHQIIGPLWNIAGAIKDGTPLPKRVIWSSGFTEAPAFNILPQPGHPIVVDPQSGAESVLIQTCDGHLLFVNDAKIEGGRDTASPWREFKKFGMVNYPDDPSATRQSFAPSVPFVEKLR